MNDLAIVYYRSVCLRLKTPKSEYFKFDSTCSLFGVKVCVCVCVGNNWAEANWEQKVVEVTKKRKERRIKLPDAITFVCVCNAGKIEEILVLNPLEFTNGETRSVVFFFKLFFILFYSPFGLMLLVCVHCGAMTPSQMGTISFLLSRSCFTFSPRPILY